MAAARRPLAPAEKEARRYKAALKTLTESVGTALRAIDRVMKQPEGVQRGKNIAALCNALEMENDKARYFVLGVDFRKDKKPK